MPVPFLDVPVPQTVGQLVEVLRLIDTVVPEQVIDVPKITSQDVIPQRAADGRTAGGRARALLRRLRACSGGRRGGGASASWGLVSGTLMAVRGAGSLVRRGSTGG